MSKIIVRIAKVKDRYVAEITPQDPDIKLEDIKVINGFVDKSGLIPMDEHVVYEGDTEKTNVGIKVWFGKNLKEEEVREAEEVKEEPKTEEVKQ